MNILVGKHEEMRALGWRGQSWGR